MLTLRREFSTFGDREGVGFRRTPSQYRRERPRKHCRCLQAYYLEFSRFGCRVRCFDAVAGAWACVEDPFLANVFAGVVDGQSVVTLLALDGCYGTSSRRSARVRNILTPRTSRLGSVDPLLMLLQSDSSLHEAIRGRCTVTASQLGRRRALIRVAEDGDIGSEFAVLIRRAVPLAASFEFLTDLFDTIVGSGQV